jgi:CHASE3 domain sensor protein
MSADFRSRLQAFRRFLNTPGFGRRVVLLLAVALLLKLAVNVTAFVLISEAERFDGEVQRAQDLRRAARGVLIDVLAAETSQRAHLLTGDPVAMDSSRESIAAVTEGVRTLALDAGGDAELAPHVAEIVASARGKTSELGVTLDLAEAGRTPDAVRIVSTGQGQALTDRLRTAVGAVDKIAGERLASGGRGAAHHRPDERHLQHTDHHPGAGDRLAGADLHRRDAREADRAGPAERRAGERGAGPHAGADAGQ